MQKKENVCGDTTLAEQGAVAQEKEECSTVLGKFKDVDALVRAYGALEAEFTRRSQRLKELEKEVENLGENGRASSGAEKLRRHAQSRKEEERKFDEFVKSVKEEDSEKETRKPMDETPKVEKAVSEEKESEMGGTELLQEGEPSAKKSNLGRSSSEEVYKQAVGDEQVRLKIIGEYLSSIGKTVAPITTAGGSVLTTPPSKIKSIGEAGSLALQYFKKGVN